MPGVGRQTAGAARTYCLRAALDARSTGRDPRWRRRAGLAGRQHLETTPWEVVRRYILIHVLDDEVLVMLTPHLAECQGRARPVGT